MSQQVLAADTVIAGKYRVVRRLGLGGMGTVYLVQHVKTDERLAMKILNPSVVENEEARERFRREARTPARIDSDYVARVIDSDIAEALGGVPFIVMEYLKGRDLQVLSDDMGPLPPKEVVTYLRHTAHALDKAHSLGIVHRDLKPENLFLIKRDDGTPAVKLLDFGVAKLTGAAADLARHRATTTGAIFGTPLYMSPEQCKSETDRVGPQTDIWALGLIAYRLLAGSDFWFAETLTHLIAQIAYEPIPLASERSTLLGRGFDLWFATCCAREVEQRFESASEAVAELELALELAPQAKPSGGFAALKTEPRAFDSLYDSQDDLHESLKQTSSALAHGTRKLVAAGVPQKQNNSKWLWAGGALALLLLGGLVLGALTNGSRSSQNAQNPPPEPSVSASTTASVNATAAATPPRPTPSASSSAVSAPATASVQAPNSAAAPPRPYLPPPRPTLTVVRPPPPPPPPPKDPLSGRH